MARVLVLCDTVGHDGGTESYLQRALPELVRAGDDVVVFARRVETSNAFGVSAGAIAWAREDEPPNLAAAAALRDVIERGAFDAVMTSNVFDVAVLAAARALPRMVVRLHDHRAFCPNGDRRYPQFPGNCERAMGGACVVNAAAHGCAAGPRPETLRRIRERSQVRDAVRGADAVVVSSGFMARLARTNGIAGERIVVVPPPLDRDAFADAPAPRPDARRLLFAGRIVPQKGLPSLIRALAHIEPAERPVLAIAGDASPEFARARSLASDLDVRLDPLGRLDPLAMRAAIDASCAVAVPSLWAEPFGLLGIEAQARGRPAVAYAVGGIPEWVGRAGIAVAPGDERALAGAIRTVLSPSSWPAFAGEASRSARDFHPDRHTCTLREVLCAS
ncbi:MAG TPA: glycosyltransferase family 4 protein [Candidatus Baltobacteraceae bacterium]|jgi:glycosyltransferase involved in cell wall biosynthesis